MGIVLQSKDYVAYLKKAAEKIAASRDYISDLDAVTGDGDHWANINMGFENVLAAFDDLEKLPIDALLKKVGMILMSKVGGSSGILYGGAYIAASKALAGKVEMGWEDICLSLEAMVNDMMERGKAKPGRIEIWVIISIRLQDAICCFGMVADSRRVRCRRFAGAVFGRFGSCCGADRFAGCQVLH